MGVVVVVEPWSGFARRIIDLPFVPAEKVNVWEEAVSVPRELKLLPPSTL